MDDGIQDDWMVDIVDQFHFSEVKKQTSNLKKKQVEVYYILLYELTVLPIHRLHIVMLLL